MTSLARILALAGVLALAETSFAGTDLWHRASSDIAVNLYQQLAKTNPGKNLIFSPHSISNSAFDDGRRHPGPDRHGDRQRAELSAARIWVLRRPRADAPLWRARKRYEQRHGRCERAVEHPGRPCQFHVANALWGEKTHPFLPSYVDNIRKYFRSGGTFAVDFRGDPQGSRRQINAWGQRRTPQKIKELLSKDNVGSDTRLLLTSQAYFKGEWESRSQRNEPIRGSSASPPARR